MIIAVCMKQVKYLYARTGKDPGSSFVGPRDYVWLNNPLDEVALEHAVQIRESLGSGEVWTLSLGPEMVEKEARRALALGSDTFVRIHDPGWGELDARATGLALSRAIERVGANLVLCGARSLDLERGEVGCYVASFLGFPFISPVVAMQRTQGDWPWVVRRGLGKGYQEELHCRLPLVLGVEKSLCEPRYPSHRARLHAQNREIMLWGGSELDLTPSAMVPSINLGHVRSPRPKPKWIPAPDGAWPAGDRIRFLLSPRVERKAGDVIRDEPEELARRLADYLRSQGLIDEKKDTRT